MHDSGLTVVHAHVAKVLRVAAGERLQISRTCRTLMAGVWALCAADLTEHLSLAHSRLHTGRTGLQVGDTMVSQRQRAMLTCMESTGGMDGALETACEHEYWGRRRHYAPDCCEDRFRAAVGAGFVGPAKAPCPWYLFAGDDPDGVEDALPFALFMPTGGVTLRAEVEQLIVVSAYPRTIHQPARPWDGLTVQVQSAWRGNVAFDEPAYAAAMPTKFMS